MQPRARASRAGKARAWLDRVAASAWFAYGSIFLIQGKVLWGIWQYRDLSDGDSSEYFASAVGWTDHLQVSPLFSPLYTAYWGSLRWLVGDTYAVTILHRVLIVIAVSLLVLVVARRLLSPGIAWLLALWWVLLPINYDTRNEVHLFAMLPLLGAVLVALAYPSLRGRAVAFGVLLTTAVLVRNEVAIAAFAWLLVCLGYEVSAPRRSDGARTLSPWRALIPFSVALGVAAAIGGLVLLRAPTLRSPGEWIDEAKFKQDFALCQHYALGWEERHLGYIANGFSHCQPFMERDFGSATPSFTEAIRRNPGAMVRHFTWNAQLAPYGLQLALFDRTSGPRRKNPAYIEERTGSPLALVGGIALLAFVALGLTLLWRERRSWWEEWIRDRVWGWAALGSLAAMGIWVVITTHPEPDYFFPLTFALLCAIGLCAMAVVRRWRALDPLRAGLPVVAAAALVLVPPHFTSGYATPVLGPGRHLAQAVSRLEPYRDRLEGSDNVLLAPHAYEICNYVTPADRCTPSTLDPNTLSPASLPALDLAGVDYVYLDETTPAIGIGALPAALEARGWTKLAPADPSAGWLLLGRPT